MRRPFTPRAVEGSVLLAALLLLGCGGSKDQSLEGSLTEVVTLDYRTADIQQSDSDVAVRFVQQQGAGENVVLRLTVSTLGTAVDANEAIDLAEPDSLGNRRGALTRNVENDPLQTFPAVARGELLFKRSLLPGDTVAGEFHVTFEQGTELASGRTVFGTFEAKVQ